MKKNQSYFEKYLDIAPFSLALWRAVEAKALREVKENYDYQSPILDLGCGFGEFSGVFFDRMIEVGIDVSPTDLLKAAQGKVYKNLYVDDARKLSLKSDSFSTVISISVLEHIPQVQKAIDEAYRVLKSDGLFIVTMPTSKLYSCLLLPRLLDRIGLHKIALAYFHLYNLAFKHINIWPQSKWLKLFTQSGFKIRYCQEILSPTVTRIFELFLITALPSQISRWLFGNRLIWGLGWKKQLLSKIFNPLIESPSKSGSNIIIVAQKTNARVSQ